MRCVVQRVVSASVAVDGAVVSRIGAGALCLVGVMDGDNDADAAWLSAKLLSLRLWDSPPPADAAAADASGAGAGARRWAASAATAGYELLLVSQFTLGARTAKAKPDFSKACPSAKAKPLFDAVVAALRARHPRGAAAVGEGVFGADMRVSLEGDGPVTILLDSRDSRAEPAAAALA
jgi:D-tyrosyl-tRNA(Tyr) deacylase